MYQVGKNSDGNYQAVIVDRSLEQSPSFCRPVILSGDWFSFQRELRINIDKSQKILAENPGAKKG